MEKGNLKISGAGSSCGGEYDIVKIGGAGTITGDILCNEFHSGGASDIRGNISSKIIKTGGACHIYGDVNGEEMKFTGSVDIEGNVTGGSVKIAGGACIKSNINCDSISVSGGVDIGGDCEGDQIEIRGGVSVGGLINASKVHIKISGKCKAREVGGEQIEVTRSEDGQGMLAKLFKSGNREKKIFICDTIEGDHIKLEYTECKVVRGKNIVIGRGCRIGKVEYIEHLDTIDDAHVEDILKL